MIDLSATFEKFDDVGSTKFKDIAEPLHLRPDLCAFLLLDKLLPNPGRDMVSGAEHDQIFLDADLDKLAEVATEEDILTLCRCGVFYDDDVESLSMFA